MDKIIKNQDLENLEVEDALYSSVFSEYPLNLNSNIIAMKALLVDHYESTMLRLHLKKFGGLKVLADKIKAVNFDERVQNGDPTLVEELSLWSKEKGRNLFSFFSKYCLNHNFLAYKKDDYVLYDSILHNHLKDYHSEYKPSHIDKLRQECDYTTYRSWIDNIIAKNNLTVPFVRRKFDFFVWSNNHKNKLI